MHKKISMPVVAVLYCLVGGPCCLSAKNLNEQQGVFAKGS